MKSNGKIEKCRMPIKLSSIIKFFVSSITIMDSEPFDPKQIAVFKPRSIRATPQNNKPKGSFENLDSLSLGVLCEATILGQLPPTHGNRSNSKKNSNEIPERRV